MIIELRGVEFHNKGAELMLHAILERIREELPDSEFVMEQGGSVPFEKLRANHIYAKLKKKRYGIRYERIGALLPKSLLRGKGYILPKEIDVVLDGSGFAFGDQWGAHKAGYRLADHVADWKRSGKKVIMLPQALGPFSDEDLIAKMKHIISYADLIFARDEVSFNYIKALSPQSSNIVLRPDFTNLIKGSLPSYFDNTKYEVAIIPNNKMIEATSDKEGEAYSGLLKNMVNIIQSMGYKPFFLIHEGKKDIKLADATNAAIEVPIQVLVEDNPLHVKGIIGASKAVITSRFHGLVSCLSQSVPCLATGWSHKYEMLLKDYHYPEALINVNSSEEELKLSLRNILDETSSGVIKSNLAKEATRQKQLSKDMWQMVFDKIKS
jgi:colanic acid/amylovoran biosynthesis protein